MLKNQPLKNLKHFNQYIYESNDGGDCYQAAGNLILFGKREHDITPHGTLYLIHGMVDGQGPLKGIRYDHAWCEDDYLIYDFSNGREIILPKQLYYAIGNIVDSDNFRYTAEQARKFILDTGHWGPWERTFEHVNSSLYLKRLINEELKNLTLYQKLISGGVESALAVFDVPNTGSGRSIVKHINISGVNLIIRDNGKIVTLFDDTGFLLARLFYDETENGKIEIGIINSFKSGEGYGKILMVYLASKYQYENINRDILTSSGENMRSELDNLFVI